MATAKELREARAWVRDLKATIGAGKAAIAEAETKAKPLVKRQATIRHRQEKVLLLTTAAASPGINISASKGDIRAMSLALISRGGLYRSGPIDDKPKSVAESLLSGDERVTMGNGQPYTLRGALRQTVIIQPAAMKPIEAAGRKVERARRVWLAAVGELEQAYAAAYKTGVKPDPIAIAANLAARFVVNPSGPTTAAHEDPRVQAMHTASRTMQVAEMHLFWLTSTPDEWAKKYSQAQFVPSVRPDECPCSRDQEQRARAERQAAEVIRLDALPTKMIECAVIGHGRHRVALDSKEVRLDEAKRAEWVKVHPPLDTLLPVAPNSWTTPTVVCPTYWCRKAKNPAEWGYVYMLQTLAEALTKAAKERARAEAKPKPKPKPKPITLTPQDDQGDSFICPSCSTTIPFDVHEPDEDSESDEPFIDCSVCGWEGDPDVVKRVNSAVAA